MLDDERIPTVYTVEEAAKLLKVSPAGLRRLVRLGVVKGARVGRRWLITAAEVRRVIDQGTQPVTLAGGRVHPGKAPDQDQDDEGASGGGGSGRTLRAATRSSGVGYRLIG